MTLRTLLMACIATLLMLGATPSLAQQPAAPPPPTSGAGIIDSASSAYVLGRDDVVAAQHIGRRGAVDDPGARRRRRWSRGLLRQRGCRAEHQQRGDAGHQQGSKGHVWLAGLRRTAWLLVPA